MKILLSLLSLAVALGLTSCEDVVDLTVPRTEPLLVVDGAVTDQAGPYVVKLTTTAPYFENQATPPVTGATLVLTSSDGQQETLREQSPGVYVSGGTVRGRVGSRYTLAIEAAGEHYQAETELRRPLPIDSIRAEYHQDNDPNFPVAGYYILYYGQDLAGKGDYVRFKVFHNGVLRNQPADLNVRTDELVDGTYFNGLNLTNDPEAGVPLRKGDRVRVEVSALTADYYRFLNEMRIQLNNTGLFAPPPANVRTNVRNLDATSPKKAVGYFAAYTVRADSLVIQ
ncbi:DUF4249 domain-containing protein [uncultured Hymenobacter sp.]|uniref:DUF4249 domain-containing protein n=1 Tax=uncultured Hymenobacter sp. TaxID=170016 RepID=UPI0035CB35A4